MFGLLWPYYEGMNRNADSMVLVGTTGTEMLWALAHHCTTSAYSPCYQEQTWREHGYTRCAMLVLQAAERRVIDVG